MNEFLEGNRALWDEWTGIHESSAFYGVEAFRAGGIRLRDYELAQVGDVQGKSLLHLQCHFGIDTLSWARLGATVTGADFSPKAIDLAGRLAADLGLDARFVESNVYDLPERLEGSFDVVYTSRGVLGWLPDIRGWARVVAPLREARRHLLHHRGASDRVGPLDGALPLDVPLPLLGARRAAGLRRRGLLRRPRAPT